MNNSQIKLAENIYWLGINDRETDLFESIIPLPKGVTYNSYAIIDDKIALLDTVKSCYFKEYFEKLKELIGNRKIDYLIVNHMEPDHSGSIKTLLEIYPDITIIGNNKTFEFLKDFYAIDKNVKIISDNEELSLGKHKLKFFITPMVHWPETMMTYEKTEKIFFSADAFGGFGTLDGGIFDDEVDISFYENEILRYFSNIIGKYCPMVQSAIKKVSALPIKIIASTHGIVWRKNPAHIIELYDKWSRHITESGVTIVYASMYGNTKKIAEKVARTLSEEGIEKIIMHDISRSHISYIIRDIWRYKGFILGSCTYNNHLFPLMDSLVHSLKNIKVTNRLLGLFGSYAWSGGALDELKDYFMGEWLTLVEPFVEIKCSPKPIDLILSEQLGKNFAYSLKNIKKEEPVSA
jgi:flavorubredoxin